MLLKRETRQERLKIQKGKLEEKITKMLNDFEMKEKVFILGINIDRRLELEEIRGSIKKVKVWVK